MFDTIGSDILMNSFLVTKKDGIVVSIVDFKHIKESNKFGLHGETFVVAPNATQLTAIAQLLEKSK